MYSLYDDQAAKDIGLYVKSDITEFLRLKEDGSLHIKWYVTFMSRPVDIDWQRYIIS